MTDQHPITVPPELIREWNEEALSIPDPFEWSDYIATQAARWGADQELEACCEWLNNTDVDDSQEAAKDLRADRRPKPPSLAKQGCDALDTYIYGNPDHKDKERTYNTIRAALDRLKELEKGDE